MNRHTFVLHRVKHFQILLNAVFVEFETNLEKITKYFIDIKRQTWTVNYLIICYKYQWTYNGILVVNNINDNFKNAKITENQMCDEKC